jgi:hypothetical protein
MLEIVPSPGSSFKGIHNARTIALIIRVDAPILNPVLMEIP